MEEKNELNDIILNKGSSSAGNKKIILAVATLGVILIVVLMLMSTMYSSDTDNSPQAMLPPQPQENTLKDVVEEPLFEEVEVVQEGAENSDSLDKIAQKLKEESNKEIEKVVVKETPQEVVKQTTPKVVTPPVTSPKTSSTANYYIQVGSFSKYEPNKKFLDSIIKQGYTYKYHKVTTNGKELTKVLVGPFTNEKDARQALITVRTFLEAGAFLIKL